MGTLRETGRDNGRDTAAAMGRGLPARCARRRQNRDEPERTGGNRLNQEAEPRTETDLNRTGGTALQANRSFARRNAGVLSETSKGSSGVPATGGAKTRGRKRLDGERFQLKSKPSGRRHASGGLRNPGARVSFPRRRAAKGGPSPQPEDEKKPETHPAVRCSWKMRKRTGQR
jgi:hypothetical protein